MPIKSYLVHPVKGQKQEAVEAISKLDGCETIPAQNKDVIVLVTDTSSKQADNELLERLSTITSVEHFALVAGYNDPENIS